MNYLTARNIVIDLPATTGDTMLLTAIHPRYRYEGNTKTEEITGYAYEVLLADKGYSVLRVTIQGACRLDMEKIAGTPRVEFNDLSLSVYALNGRTGVSAKASGIRIKPE